MSPSDKRVPEPMADHAFDACWSPNGHVGPGVDECHYNAGVGGANCGRPRSEHPAALAEKETHAYDEHPLHALCVAQVQRSLENGRVYRAACGLPASAHVSSVGETPAVEIHDGTVRGWPLYVTVGDRVVADIPGDSVEDARPTAEFIAAAFRAAHK